MCVCVCVILLVVLFTLLDLGFLILNGVLAGWCFCAPESWPGRGRFGPGLHVWFAFWLLYAFLLCNYYLLWCGSGWQHRVVIKAVIVSKQAAVSDILR